MGAYSLEQKERYDITIDEEMYIFVLQLYIIIVHRDFLPCYIFGACLYFTRTGRPGGSVGNLETI